MYPDYLTIIVHNVICVSKIWCNILQSKINIEFTCTCMYNVLLLRFLCVSPDWIEIQFTKKKFLLMLHVNTCTSIHNKSDIFTFGCCTSVGSRLTFIPQPLPIPSHPFTLNNFCTGYVFKFVNKILILFTFLSQ